MASPKKDKDNAKPKPKEMKVLSKQEAKKVRGGLASSVGGGLAGPESFRFD